MTIHVEYKYDNFGASHYLFIKDKTKMSIEVVQMEKLYLGGKKNQLSTLTYTAEMEISYNRD